MGSLMMSSSSAGLIKISEFPEPWYKIKVPKALKWQILSEIHLKKKILLYKTFTRRTPNGIIDGFIRKVNQKIKLPDDTCPSFAFLKHECFENPSNKKVSNLLYSAL